MTLESRVLVLEVVTGPDRGRAVEVSAQGSVEVGRSEPAEFTFPADRFMSRRHFELFASDGVWWIRDSNSRGGTKVNGVPIQEAQLTDGDAIIAGNTAFGVRLIAKNGAGRLAPAVSAAPGGESARYLETAARDELPLVPQGSEYTHQECNSTLDLFQPATDRPKPVHLARWLAQYQPLYIIADLTKIGEEVPANMKDPLFLFDWLPPELQRTHSPILLPTEGRPKIFNLLDKGWGKDALLCVFSAQPVDQVFEHWRAICRGQQEFDVPPRPGSMLGACWPSILAQLLSSSSPDRAKFLLGDASAVMMETFSSPPAWQVFSGDGFASALNALGMKQKADKPASA